MPWENQNHNVENLFNKLKAKTINQIWDNVIPKLVILSRLGYKIKNFGTEKVKIR